MNSSNRRDWSPDAKSSIPPSSTCTSLALAWFELSRPRLLLDQLTPRSQLPPTLRRGMLRGCRPTIPSSPSNNWLRASNLPRFYVIPPPQLTFWGNLAASSDSWSDSLMKSRCLSQPLPFRLCLRGTCLQRFASPPKRLHLERVPLADDSYVGSSHIRVMSGAGAGYRSGVSLAAGLAPLQGALPSSAPGWK